MIFTSQVPFSHHPYTRRILYRSPITRSRTSSVLWGVRACWILIFSLSTAPRTAGFGFRRYTRPPPRYRRHKKRTILYARVLRTDNIMVIIIIIIYTVRRRWYARAYVFHVHDWAYINIYRCTPAPEPVVEEGAREDDSSCRNNSSDHRIRYYHVFITTVVYHRSCANEPMHQTHQGSCSKYNMTRVQCLRETPPVRASIRLVPRHDNIVLTCRNRIQKRSQV